MLSYVLVHVRTKLIVKVISHGHECSGLCLQLEETFCRVILPGFEAWGYGASANSAFIVRADALQAIKWFPTYTLDLGLSLGIEFKIAKFLAKFHNEILVRGKTSFDFPRSRMGNLCLHS